MLNRVLAALLICGGGSLTADALAQTDRRPPLHGVSLQLGTTGAGVQVSRQLTPRLTARVGASYLAFRSALDVKTGAEGGSLNIQPDLVLGIGQATLKWHPFFSKKKHLARSFFLTAGAGYTWRPDFNLTLRATETIRFGGMEITPEHIGTVQTGLSYRNLMGYGGLGFGRSIPRRRVGFGFELGSYVLSSPTVNLHYDGFLEATTLAEQVPTVERNLKNYRFLPSLQVHLSYRIGKRI